MTSRSAQETVAITRPDVASVPSVPPPCVYAPHGAPKTRATWKAAMPMITTAAARAARTGTARSDCNALERIIPSIGLAQRPSRAQQREHGKDAGGGRRGRCRLVPYGQLLLLPSTISQTDPSHIRRTTEARCGFPTGRRTTWSGTWPPAWPPHRKPLNGPRRGRPTRTRGRIGPPPSGSSKSHSLPARPSHPRGLVQIFAPGVAAFGAAKYYELIFERELPARRKSVRPARQPEAETALRT